MGRRRVCVGSVEDSGMEGLVVDSSEVAAMLIMGRQWISAWYSSARYDSINVLVYSDLVTIVLRTEFFDKGEKSKR